MYTSTTIQKLIADHESGNDSSEFSDGELLDLILDSFLDSYDPALSTYITSTDGNEMTDFEAIKLVLFRIEQLQGNTP